MSRYLHLLLLFLVPATASLYAQEEAVSTGSRETVPKVSYLSFGAGTDNWLFQELSTEEKISLANDLQMAGYATDSFDCQRMDIIVPLNLGYGGFSAGFSFIYSVIADKYKAVGMANQPGFMFSVDYMIPF